MPRRLLSFLACLSLAGCSAVAALDRAAVPQDVHEMRAPQDLPAAAAPADVQLVIDVPAAARALDTDRILVRPGGTRIAYLPDARWSAPAPEMLQAAMVEAFLRSGAFAFVGRRPLGASGDVALVTTLLDFDAKVAAEGDAATVEMTLIARLVRERDAAIVATRTLSRAVAVPDTSSAAILAGFEDVSEGVLSDLARWVVAALG